MGRVVFYLLVWMTGLLGGVAAQAQQYRQSPTDGVHLPTNPIAGEYDSLSVVGNPAGLAMLWDREISAALDLAEDNKATSSGQGVGFYAAAPLGGLILPRFGLGFGVEFLRHPRANVVPDPGKPVRLTASLGIPISRSLAVGISWHRFHDLAGRPLDGANSFDFGGALRLNNRWAIGVVARDLSTPEVSGETVQRRYWAEVALRPLQTERLEVALAAGVGEQDMDVESKLRVSAKIFPGAYLKGEMSTLNRELISPDTGSETNRRELRFTAGLEVSFGNARIATYGTGVAAENTKTRFRGGTLVAKLSQRPVPPLIPRPKRIELIGLKGSLTAPEHTSLIMRLRRIRRDDGVRAVLIRFDGFGTGWADAQELRGEIVALREVGKPVFVHAVLLSNREYFIASAATKVYVDPAGGLRLSGLSVTALYFKGLLTNIGVDAQFEKIEEYKTAPEAYTRTGPSPEAELVRKELVDSVYREFTTGIASGRKLELAKTQSLINEGPYSAGQLKKSPELVDAVVPYDKVLERVHKVLGGRYALGKAPHDRPDRWGYPGIAVIHIEGDIVDGKSRKVPVLGRRLVGSETITKAIAGARADPRVRAIVLRINSPGGNAVASELMAREVFKTRKAKPIICSMGNLAASGGYFAAVGCDVIFADPMTITGSIGIFYGKFDISALMTQIGVSWRNVKRGRRADTESMLRPYTDEERAFIKERLQYLYGRFIDNVAKGRKMKSTEVDKVGRGRVWTGAQAKPIRLIDRFGGVGDAIFLAKQRAGFGPGAKVQVVMLPRQPTSLLKRVLSLGGSAQRTPSLHDWPMLDVLKRVFPGALIADPLAAQARLPFALVWR